MQTEFWLLLALLLGFLLGFLIAFIWQGKHSKQWQQQHSAAQHSLQEQARQLGLAEQSLQHQNQQTDTLRQQNQAKEQELRAHIDELKTQRHSLQTELRQAAEQAQALAATQAALKEQLQEGRSQLQALQNKHETLQHEQRQLGQSHSALQAQMQGKEQQLQAQMQQLNEAKTQMGESFQNLANRLFEEKSQSFSAHNQSQLAALLQPFKEQIDGFQKRINEVHDAALKGNTSLQSEIKKVLDIGLQMNSEASKLSSALKGDSQQRGAWGEAQLRRTLEMSGLLEDAHYAVQSSFKDEDGARKQTDFLIKLPDGKNLIIDSKVTLNAYDRVVAATAPEQAQSAMQEHLAAVRQHIKDLAGKNYSQLYGINSPDFVLMFMPIEPAYIEALKQDSSLFEYGYSKNIILVSHTTLLPILRTVSNLWLLERSNSQARELAGQAGKIYDSIATVAERLHKLGGQLQTASKQYNSTVTALVGQRGLLGQAERFQVFAQKTMPDFQPLEEQADPSRLEVALQAQALLEQGEQGHS